MRKLLLTTIVLCLAATCLTGCQKGKDNSSSSEESQTESEISTEAETETEVETEIETEPETEVASAPAREKKSSPANVGAYVLSDDIYSFQVQIDGTVYQFPMPYEEFIACGWTYGEDATIELAPNQYTLGGTVSMGDLKASAPMINFDVNTLPISECYVGGLSISDYQLKNLGDVEILLPGNFDCLASNAEQAKEQFGTPSRENTTDRGTTTLEYQYGPYQTVTMVFDADTKLLSELRIRNLAEPDNFTAGGVSAEVPEIVNKYSAPGALSDNLADFIVEFGGDLYMLPAPVCEFAGNGWTIDADSSAETVSGRDSGWVTLMKDNQKLRTLATNYSESATSIENCFVTSVSGSDYSGENISIKIARGIEKGISKAELEAALNGIDYDVDEGSTYLCYVIRPTSSIMDKYELMVNKESGMLYKINAVNKPSYSDYTGK